MERVNATGRVGAQEPGPHVAGEGCLRQVAEGPLQAEAHREVAGVEDPPGAPAVGVVDDRGAGRRSITAAPDGAADRMLLAMARRSCAAIRDLGSLDLI
jgi:hypothetical protein